MKNIFHNFILIFILCACNNEPNLQNNNSNKNEIVNHKIIIIQPFKGLPKVDIEFVAKQLSNIYNKIDVRNPIPLPRKAFNINRSRYRADSLIKFLSKTTPPGFLTIGLTDKDISATKNNVQDWGLMGLGYCPGNSCIASTFRLNKAKKGLQLFKVAIHELGHTEGLKHCVNKNCYMRDAKGKNHTDDLSSFCKTCKNLLIQKGWCLK
jgi:archaemetzincin